MKKILVGLGFYILIIVSFLGVYWLGLNSYSLYEKGINSGFIFGGFLFICNIIFLLFVFTNKAKNNNSSLEN